MYYEKSMNNPFEGCVYNKPHNSTLFIYWIRWVKRRMQFSKNVVLNGCFLCFSADVAPKKYLPI